MKIARTRHSKHIQRASGLALCGAVSTVHSPVYADFITDSKASMDLRNYYFNRDFRQSGVAQSKAEEWAQGFVLRYESGFTPGAIGVGLDALGMLGIKLDSGPSRTGTGLLVTDRDGRVQDEYSKLGLTAKIRMAQSTLKAGTLMPKLPVAVYNDTRLLPQTFRGAWLNSADLSNTTFDLGRFDRINLRNSTDNESMTVSNAAARNIQFGRKTSSERFDFAGVTYRWTPALSTAYHYGALDGIYQQHYLTLNHKLALTERQSLTSDIRWARSLDEGGSNVENSALGAMFTYSAIGHSVGLGYQRMSGATGFANLYGTDAYLINLVQINDFGNQDERSWQLRYDYNFTALGIPGLTFMTRYLSGDEVSVRNRTQAGKEWERDTELAYVIQSGALKNLALKWKNASTRSNFASDIDENRLILSYSLPIW
ncbi:OprD family porin [Pseudomonas sp. GM55]|uniref:OprD family porin n=1 Tax=Pseudomonas sp. GM55 TaxID=1144333 RepID=UPI00068F0FF5|nr:OprD family porin [Pseudomonas sp. GM55]